ncbi:hypothetical protein JCM11491_005002 [Sporobolomyces phaffii]
MSAYLLHIPEDCSISSDLLPNFKVFVEIEGRPAKVYGVEPNEDESVIHCAIEGRAGAQFSLAFLDNRRSTSHPMACEIHLEGERVGACARLDKWPHWNDPKDYRGRCERISEIRVDKKHVRPLRFGAVPFTDDQAVSFGKDQDEMIESVATVALHIYRGQSVKESSKTFFDEGSNLPAVIDKNVLHEKQKKAQFAFSAGVGEKEKKDQSSVHWIDLVGCESEPFVKYIFTIWSRAGLEIKGYVKDTEDVKPSIALLQAVDGPAATKKRARPRSPSPPVASTSGASLATNSKTKLAKLAATQEARGVGEGRVKQEDGEGPKLSRCQPEEVVLIRRGKTLYIDFDEDEVEEEEAKKSRA